MMPFNKNDLFKKNLINSVQHLQLEIETIISSTGAQKTDAITVVSDVHN